MKLLNMKLLVLGVASIMAMASTPVFAVSSASANLGDLTVSLISLGSSVTPTITWADSNNNSISVYAYDYANANYQSNSAYGAGNLSAAVSTAISQASGSVNQSGLGNHPPFTNMSGSGSTGSVGTSGGLFEAYTQSNDSFTLSANTIAIFTAPVTTNAQTTVGYDSGTGSTEEAQAIAQLTTSGYTGNGYQSSYETLSSYANYTLIWNPITLTYDGIGQSVNKTGSLGVAFTNLSNSSATGSLQAYADVYGYSNVAGVPEPSSWAMMLGGLGLIGFMTYRRRQYL